MSVKKVFIIFIILLVLAGGTLVVYNLFLKNRGNAPAQRETSFPETELSLKINAVSKEKALAPAIGEDGKTIKYYLQKNGLVFSSSFDGSNIETLSTNELKDLSKIIWSPDAKKVIGILGSAAAKKYFYDHETKKAVLLNENIQLIAWAPSSQKIAYHYETPDGQYNNINIANPDGTNWRSIFQTRLTDLIIQWPSPDKIYIFNKPSGSTQSSLFAIDPDSGDFAKILSDLYGLAAKFSPDGQKMIYASTEQNGKNLKLYVAQADGNQLKELPLKTLPEKCVWSLDNETLFCAVPQQFSEHAVWPDDYNLGRISISDDFYIINANSLQKTKIAGPGTAQSFDAQNLILSPNGDYLFFINKKDGLVYNIKLELQ